MYKHEHRLKYDSFRAENDSFRAENDSQTHKNKVFTQNIGNFENIKFFSQKFSCILPAY